MIPSSRTILFQPPNRLGLGHISRLSAIALTIRELDQSIRVPFAVEGAGHVLLDSLKLPYVPLPGTHDLYKSGRWDEWSHNDRSGLNAEVSRAIMGKLAPQAVVFDCLPSLAMAAAAVEKRIPIILCMREMRDVRSYIHRLSWFPKHVEAVIVPHETGACEVPDEFIGKTIFVGRIARTPRTPDRTSDLERRRVIITGGGGGDGVVTGFYNLALEALAEACRQDPRIDAQLIAGPLFEDWANLRLVAGVRLLPYVPDLPTLLASSDLIICQAGYNTIAEVQQSGTPAICIPAPRVYDDQDERAQKLARESSHFRVMNPSNANELAAAIHAALAVPVLRTAIAEPPGNRAAAQFLIDFVRRRQPAAAVAASDS